MVKIARRNFFDIRMFYLNRDTAGQERFRFDDDLFIAHWKFIFFCRSLIPSYIRDSTVAVVVFDITSKNQSIFRYRNCSIDVQIPTHFNKLRNGLMMFVRNVVVMLS